MRNWQLQNAETLNTDSSVTVVHGSLRLLSPERQLAAQCCPGNTVVDLHMMPGASGRFDRLFCEM